MRSADLRAADLTGSRFGSVNTGMPSFGLTDVTGARFAGATLPEVHAEGVVGWPRGHDGKE